MRRINFWLLLAILAGLLTTATAWAAPANTTINIFNNTGYQDSRIYLIVWGRQVAAGSPYRLDFTNGNLVACTTHDNTLTVYDDYGRPYPDKYCQYWINLNELTKNADGSYSFTCPPIVSGRLFFSFQKPLYFRVDPKTGAMTEPSAETPADPSYKTIWDKIEWTLDQYGLHTNITEVDFITIPFQLKMLIPGGTPDHLGPAGFTSSRGTVFRALSATPPFSLLRNMYRFANPKTTDPSLRLPSDYYKPYVDYVWANCWQTADSLKVVANGSPFTGQINGNVLTATYDTNPSEVHTIDKPTKSWDVFACAGVFQGVTGPQPGYIGRDADLKNKISAALNRSVMHLPVNQWSDTNQYYKNTLPLADADKFRTNVYSKILHEIAIDHYAYGFPYDDNGDKSGYLTDPEGTALVLTMNYCKDMGYTSAIYELLLEN